MDQKHNRLTDVLVVLGMVVFVFLLCQPLGRKWDEGTTEMFTGEEGVYSSDSDSFYYLRKAREFTQNGFSSIRLFTTRDGDRLMTFFSGEGKDAMPVLPSTIAAVIWYFLQAIGIHVGIYTICMHLCGVILALCTIPAYLFLRKRTSRMAAVLGSVLGVLSTAYLQHSFEGFFDTDAFIALFGLIMVLSLHDCVLGKTKKDQIIYGVLSMVSAVALATTWGMYHIYVLIAVGTGAAAVIISRLFFVKKEDRTLQLRIPVAVMGLMIAGVVISGWRDCYILLRDVLFSVKGGGNWPSTYENVTEMARPGLLSEKSFWEFFLGLKTDYVSYMGGLIAFIYLGASAILYSIFTFRRKQESSEESREEFLCRYFMVAVWFCGAAVMCYFGIRFTQFLVLPAILLWAYGFDIIEKYIGGFSVAGRRIIYVCCAAAIYSAMVFASPLAAVITAGVVLITGFFSAKLKGTRIIKSTIFAALLLGTVVSAYLRGALSVPMLEKPTVSAMTWIRDNTDEAAVIADFWSWGYRYQYYAERRTVADGGSYSGAMNYWLGNMMFTDDEKLSAGIVRMLQANGTKGTEYAVELFGDEAKACSVLKEILGLTHDDAKVYLKEQVNLSDEKSDKLLAYTHPEQIPEIYFIADQEGLLLSYSLGRFPQWDFSGIKANSRPTLVTEESVKLPGKGEEGIAALWAKGLTDNVKIVYKWEGERIIGRVLDEDNIFYAFSKILYIKNGERLYEIEKDQADNGEILMEKRALIVFEENGRLSAVVADENLLDSVVFRLYLYDGEGQDTFTKVYSEEIPERILGESSHIQRKLGTWNSRNYRNCGITVWKVQFE